MIVAFHFRAEAERPGAIYSWDIQKAFFRQLLALQDAGLHLEILTGDLLHNRYSNDPDATETLLRSVLGYDPRRWSTLHNEDFGIALSSTTIYILAVQGLSRSALHFVDRQLRQHRSYLGSLQIDPADPVHWNVYRDRLHPRYRYFNREIRLFYPKFEETAGADVRDWGTAKDLQTLPFRSVEWEDIGVRHTLFDSFHSPAHAKRVAELDECLSGHLGRVADEVLMRTSVLNPQLQTTLHAAVKAFERIETAEQVAHVGLSCRLFLEGLADALHPPSDKLVNGRIMGPEAYRNRLWAYVEEQLKGDERGLVLAQLKDVGNRLDRLDSVANKGLHAQNTPSEIRRLIVGVVMLAYDLLSMAPPPTDASLAPYS
jgi:hypothetical protein